MSIELTDKLYTSTQVADILGVSLRTLYRYMEDEKIQSMRTASGRHRFTKDQILDFLNAGNTPSSQDSSSQSMSSQPSQPTSSFATPRVSPMNTDISEGQGFSSDNIQNNDVGMKTDDISTASSPSDFGVKQSRVETTKTMTFDDDLAAKEPIGDEQDETAEPVAQQAPQPRVEEVPAVTQPKTQAQSFASSSITTASTPQSDPNSGLGTGINIRYYKSDYTDLIELAKRIKDAATSKDLEYAFTLNAGLSLHLLIKPFTKLHIYANPEDMQIWKDELRLAPVTNREDANVGIIINTDIVFAPTKEIGGFRVVEDKVLLRDLSQSGEEELVKQFRQHLMGT